ncbi:MAG: Rpn family recombination-promoting nuclease/putative transposase, partial [Pseudomonadota bacterium]|nr:Rpn family recombination-promoting nuclease/putative transposase [Pseudomonadota bacterium]
MFPVHDRGYKRLFSHPRIFRQLLESFVHEHWVKELDFEQCEKINKSFISEHYKATESDLLSPWYPTMRLFRQSKIGDWHSVFIQVKQALIKILASQENLP